MTAATTPTGSYTVFVKADGRGATIGGSNTDAGYVSEADETNNTMARGIVLPSRADLVISSASLGTIVKNWDNSRSITVTFAVTNQGALAAPPTWFDLAYLSADSVLDNTDVNLSGYSTANVALAAGASYTVTKTYLASANIPAGIYSLILKTDGRGATIGGANTDSGYVAESNETNNVWVIPVTLP